MNQPTLLQLSQPKAWMWVFIPFVLGVLASGVHPAALFHPTVGVFALYFTLPANLLLYGVEYIYDRQVQGEKNSRELWKLKWQIIAVTAPFLLLIPYLDVLAIITFIIFIAAAIAYARPPVRAKDRPGLRTIFWLRFLLPAAFGFFLVGGDLNALT